MNNKFSDFINKYNNAWLLLLAYLIYEGIVSLISIFFIESVLIEWPIKTLSIVAIAIGPVFLGLCLKQKHHIAWYALFNVAIVAMSILGSAVFLEILSYQWNREIPAQFQNTLMANMVIIEMLIPSTILKLLIFNVIYFTRIFENRKKEKNENIEGKKTFISFILQKFNHPLIQLIVFLLCQIACIFVIIFWIMFSAIGGGSVGMIEQVIAIVIYITACSVGALFLGFCVKQNDFFWSRWMIWNVILVGINIFFTACVILKWEWMRHSLSPFDLTPKKWT